MQLPMQLPGLLSQICLDYLMTVELEFQAGDCCKGSARLTALPELWVLLQTLLGFQVSLCLCIRVGALSDPARASDYIVLMHTAIAMGAPSDLARLQGKPQLM